MDVSAERPAAADPAEKEGLVGALARALASRNQQIHGGGTVVMHFTDLFEKAILHVAAWFTHAGVCSADSCFRGKKHGLASKDMSMAPPLI